MANKDILKKRAEKYLDGITSEIYEIGETLMNMPELGYKEFKTVYAASGVFFVKEHLF